MLYIMANQVTHTSEHEQVSVKGKWETSGANEHCLKSHRQFIGFTLPQLKTKQNILKEK